MFANSSTSNGRSTCEIISGEICVGLMVNEGSDYWISDLMGQRVSSKSGRGITIQRARQLSPTNTADMMS